MYNDIANFIPFEHGNLEFKNNLISNARNQNKTTLEGMFTAVLIYANVVDYISRSLLKNIAQMVSISSYKKFNGIFFYENGAHREFDSMPLGELIKELKNFDFPNKNDYLGRLKEFKSLRNQIMHNLLEVDPNDQTKKIDNDLEKIVKISEDLLTKYNVIVTGLTTAWNINLE
jgi:uncharacterized protein with HEPN domain